MLEDRAESFACHFRYFVKELEFQRKNCCGEMVVALKIPGAYILGWGNTRSASALGKAKRPRRAD